MVELNARDAQRIVEAAFAALASLPPQARERFTKELFGLIDGGALKLAVLGLPATAATGNNIVRLGIVGFDELIASALGAANLNMVTHRAISRSEL